MKRITTNAYDTMLYDQLLEVEKRLVEVEEEMENRNYPRTEHNSVVAAIQSVNLILDRIYERQHGYLSKIHEEKRMEHE